MSERGMKKWAPYKSLPEHDPKIIEMEKNRKKIDKPLISSDVAAEINEVLVNYHGQPVEVKYYQNGTIKYTNMVIKKIDANNRKIVSTEGKNIEFNDILYITSL